MLIGRSGGEALTAYDMAQAAGTITNEIFTSLGARLPRMVKPAGRKPKSESMDAKRETEGPREQQEDGQEPAEKGKTE